MAKKQKTVWLKVKLTQPQHRRLKIRAVKAGMDLRRYIGWLARRAA